MRSIAYVLPEYPLPAAPEVHAELAALRRLGFLVHVFAEREGTPAPDAGEDADAEPLAGVGLADAVPRLRDYDHLHGHFAAFSARILAPIADAAARPFSFTVHGSDLFGQAEPIRLHEWRGVAGRAQRVVALSRFHRDLLLARCVPADKLAVIPNAAALGQCFSTAAPPPTALRRVLAVGPPLPRNGLPALIQAWEAARRVVPGLELDVIDGEGLVRDGPPGLRLWPVRSRPLVIEAMRLADVVVAPGIVAPDGNMGNIPWVLAVACALRRPVIASRLGGLDDLVADGVNGLVVPPGDVPALTAALVRLAQRPGELTRLGDAGPQLAAAHDADVVARRLVYEAFAA